MKRLREIMGAALLLLAPALAFAGAEGEGAGAAPDTLSAPGVYPISDALITVTALGNVDARIQDITTNYAVTWLEEQTNLHVEWDVVTGADAGQKINLVLAAGSDLPDMIINSGITTEQQFLYGSQGYLAPLEGLIEEHTVDIKRVFAEDPLVPRQLTAPDGHIYALSERPVAYHSTLSQKLWINVEWLERLGLEMPATTAELRAVLEAFRDQDANGNGDPNDEIPYSGLINYWRSRPGAFVMNAFIYDDGFGDPTNSHRMVVNDGVISPAFTTGEWRRGLSFLNGLYRDGLFDGEAFVMDRSQLHTLNNGGVEGPARVGAHQAGVPWGALAPQGTMHRQYRAVPPLIRALQAPGFQTPCHAAQALGKTATGTQAYARARKGLFHEGLAFVQFPQPFGRAGRGAAERMVAQHPMRIGMRSDLERRHVAQQRSVRAALFFQALAHDEKRGGKVELRVDVANGAAGREALPSHFRIVRGNETRHMFSPC